MVDAIIFDLDGLIVDSESVAHRVWEILCREQGFELNQSLHQSGVGRGMNAFLSILQEAFGEKFDTQLIQEKRPLIWRKVLEEDGLKRKPGFDDLLRYLEAQKIPRAIATSTERELVTVRFRASGVDPTRFQSTVAGDEVPKPKPAPDVYLQAARNLGVDPSRCLALEDSDVGAAAAHAAGIRVIVIPDLFPPNEKTRAFAFRVLDSLSGVPEIIEELRR